MLKQVLQQTASKAQPETDTETDTSTLASRLVMAKSQNQSDVTYRASAIGLGAAA